MANLANSSIEAAQRTGITKVSMSLLKLAQDSFNKEKSLVYDKIGFDIKYLAQFLDDKKLFNFLIALSNFFSNSNNNDNNDNNNDNNNNFSLNYKNEAYDLDFSDKSFLKIMTSSKFYALINFDKINPVISQCLEDTYENWYSAHSKEINEFIKSIRATSGNVSKKFGEQVNKLISEELINAELVNDDENKSITVSVETPVWIKVSTDNGKIDLVNSYNKFNNYTARNFKKDLIRFLQRRETTNDLLDYDKILDDVGTKGYSDADKVGQAFFILVSNALNKIDVECSNSFTIWWDNNIKTKTKELFSDFISKMLSVKNREKFIGNLGEIMLRMFNNRFSTLTNKENNKQKQGNNIDNFITGRIRNTYGEIAVDNLLIFKQAEKALAYLGFQSKLFPSYEVAGEGIFYQQSNQIYNEKDSLNKYLQGDADLFKGNLFCYSLDEFEDERSSLSEEMLDILGKHIPEYIRMIDTTEGISEKELNRFLTQEMEKSGIIMNNFYSINFRIFPSSLILLLLSKHIIHEKNNNKDIINNSFYISIKEPVKKDGKLRWRTSGIIEDNQKNFQSSLANNDILQLIQKKQSKEKETTVFLNFKGINIKFKSANINNLVNFAI